MSAEAAARLAARNTSQYLNGGHVTYFVPDLNDLAAVANWTASNATQAALSAAAAAASYTLMLGLGASAYGIGIDLTDLVRAGQLGNLAFMDFLPVMGIFTNTQNGAYTIRADDFGKMLLTTTGTNTWTLPAAATLPEGWYCYYRNRSGNNLTVNRAGADTFNAAATTIAIATASPIGRIVRTSSSTFEVA